jgi:hypothetical protein
MDGRVELFKILSTGGKGKIDWGMKNENKK